MHVYEHIQMIVILKYIVMCQQVREHIIIMENEIVDLHVRVWMKIEIHSIILI